MKAGPSPINIAAGQESAAEALGGATSEVINWEIDAAGANQPRAAVQSFACTGLGTSPVTGLARWGPYTIVSHTDGTWHRVADVDLTFALQIDDGTNAAKLLGGKRPTFVAGELAVYATAGGQIRGWTGVGMPSATLTSSPFCTHIASIGQYLIANDLSDTMSFAWSDIGEGSWSTWPAANSTAASARPDPIVGIFENTNELFVFGSETLQVYQVGNDPTLPFDLAASTNIGLMAPYAVCRLDESFVWLDDKMRIVIGDGRANQEISASIRSDLRSLSYVADAFAYREEIGKQSNVVFRFPTAAKTFVYDVDGKRWSQRARYQNPSQRDYPIAGYAYVPSRNTHLVGLGSSSGGLATLATSGSTTDLSGALVCDRTTAWHDHGTPGLKRSQHIGIVATRGIGADTGDLGTLEVRTQEDDRGWGAWSQVDVGRLTDLRKVVKAYKGGIFRRRRYQFRQTCAERLALAEAYDVVEELRP